MADNLTISIGADTSRLRADLAKAQAEVKGLGAELRKAAVESNKTGDRSALDAISAQYEAARGKAMGLAAAIRRMGVAHGDAAHAIGEASGAVSGMTRSLVSLFDEFERGQRGSMVATLGAAIRRSGESWEGMAAGVALVAGALYLFSENASEAVHQRETEAASLGTTATRYGAAVLAAESMGASQEQVNVALRQFAAASGRAQLELAQQAERTERLRDAQVGLRLSNETAALSLIHQRREIAQLENSVNLAAAAYDRSGIGANLDAMVRARDALDEAQARFRIEQERSAEGLHREAEAVDRLQKAVHGLPGGARAGAALAQIFAGIAPRADILTQLEQYADRFNHLANQAQKAAQAQHDFGENWQPMVALLSLGGAGLADLVDKMSAYTQVTEAETAEAGRFMAAHYKMLAAIEMVKNEIGTAVGRAFVPLMNGLADFTAAYHKQISEVSSGIAQLIDFVFQVNATQLRFWVTIPRVLFDVIKAIGAATGATTFLRGVAIDATSAVEAAFRKVGDIIDWVRDHVRDLAATLDHLKFHLPTWAGGEQQPVASAAIPPLPGQAPAAAPALSDSAKAATAAWDDARKAVAGLWSSVKDTASAFPGLGSAATAAGDAAHAAAERAAKGWQAATQAVANTKAAVDVIAGAGGSAGGVTVLRGASAGTPAPGWSAGPGVSVSTEGGVSVVRGGYARGGFVRGLGSAFSDSIPAHLSNGEYVLRAPTVARLGVGFLDHLNFGSMTPARPALGFASGGLVASGGGGTTHTFVIEGKSFSLSASEETTQQLIDHARFSHMVRAGPLPSHSGY